jgi:hypothetical protein
MGIDFGNPDKGIFFNLQLNYQYPSEYVRLMNSIDEI